MPRSRLSSPHVQVRDSKIVERVGFRFDLERIAAVVAEPTGNVAPRVAGGERYEGGKLVDVPVTLMVALDCTTQGSPVPVARYPPPPPLSLSPPFANERVSEGTGEIGPRASGKRFEREVVSAARGRDVALSHSLQGFPAPLTR